MPLHMLGGRSCPVCGRTEFHVHLPAKTSLEVQAAAPPRRRRRAADVEQPGLFDLP